MPKATARASRPAAHPRSARKRRHVMTVLVGVKRSADARAAIRLAAQEARYRDTTLIAVMAYPAERGWSPAVKPGSEASWTVALPVVRKMTLAAPASTHAAIAV